MRGAIRSSLVILIAILAVCFISVPGYSGEHPWDSDGKESGSTGSSGGSGDTSKGSTAISSTSAYPGGGGQIVHRSQMSPMSLVFRVSYYVAEKLYFSKYEAGTQVGPTARKAGR